MLRGDFMINTTSIEKRAEILRRFKGWLNEKIYQEIEDAMNELRKFHSGEKGVSKGIKTVIKESEAALIKAEKSIKGKEFLTVALSIGDFYKINKKLLIDTKRYIATLEDKYQKAYDDIDDQHIDAINEIKSIMDTPMTGDSAKSELEKSLQTKGPIKNIGANEKYELITEAGFFDWFRKSLSKQDITDKMFEKRSKTFRDQSKQMVDLCKKLQAVLNSRVKILDEAINHRDIGDYIDGMGDYAKKFSEFELNFNTYYNNWLKKVYEHKMNERKKRDEELAKAEKERIEREEKNALLNQVNGVKPSEVITDYDDALINYVSKLFDAKKSLYSTKLALRNSMNMAASIRFNNPTNNPENDEIFKNVPPENIKGKNIISDAKKIIAATIEELVDDCDLPEKVEEPQEPGKEQVKAPEAGDEDSFESVKDEELITKTPPALPNVVSDKLNAEEIYLANAVAKDTINEKLSITEVNAYIKSLFREDWSDNKKRNFMRTVHEQIRTLKQEQLPSEPVKKVTNETNNGAGPDNLTINDAAKYILKNKLKNHLSRYYLTTLYKDNWSDKTKEAFNKAVFDRVKELENKDTLKSDDLLEASDKSNPKLKPGYWINLLEKQDISEDKWESVLKYNLEKTNISEEKSENIINKVRSYVGDKIASRAMDNIIKLASGNQYDLAIKILSYSDQLESIDTDRSNKLLAIAEGILDGTR